MTTELFKNKKDGKKTVNEYINIQNIVGNILYTKDDYIMCYVRVKPLVISIMSEQEKWGITEVLTSNFSQEKEPITILKVDRPIDIRNIIMVYQSLIQDLKTDMLHEKNRIKKDILTANMFLLDEHASDGGTLENLYYIQFYKKFNGNNESELLRRAKNYIYKFSLAGIETELINDSEIKELCALFANLGYSYKETDNYDDSLNIIKKYHLD